MFQRLRPLMPNVESRTLKNNGNFSEPEVVFLESEVEVK